MIAELVVTQKLKALVTFYVSVRKMLDSAPLNFEDSRSSQFYFVYSVLMG